MQCFCGCGRKVTFGARSVSKRGAIIDGDLAFVRDLVARGLDSPAAEAFVHDGDILCGLLAESIHEQIDPGPDVELETRGFMAFGRNFSQGALGKAVQRSGMSVDDAVAAMTKGEWDPFSEVEVPT